MPSSLLFPFILMGMISFGHAQLTSEQSDQVDKSMVKIDLTANNISSATKVKAQKKTLAIISCSGKSGSTTLQSSFNNLGIKTHRFHLLVDKMYDYILEAEKDTVILLIDSMRDIISRKIASYFQHLQVNLKMKKGEILELYKKDRKHLFKTIQKQLDKKILVIAHFHAFRDWKKFNYDCLKDGVFDFEKKYQLKKIGNLYFVNLRFDDIANWQEIIQSLDVPINFNKFQIVSANKSEDKWYRTIYKDFLTGFTISKTNFNAIISDFSEEMAHFYKEKELEAFIEKWEPHLID